MKKRIRIYTLGQFHQHAQMWCSISISLAYLCSNSFFTFGLKCTQLLCFTLYARGGQLFSSVGHISVIKAIAIELKRHSNRIEATYQTKNGQFFPFLVQMRPKMAFSEAKNLNIFAKIFVIFSRFWKIEISELSENIKKITLNSNFGN